MPASREELAAFAARRQAEDEYNATAYVGECYRRAGDAFDVLTAYLDRLSGEERARVLDAACNRVEQTIAAEYCFLAACGRVVQQKEPPMWNKIFSVAAIIVGAAGVIAAAPLGLPAVAVAIATKVVIYGTTAGIVAAKVLPGHGAYAVTPIVPHQ